MTSSPPGARDTLPPPLPRLSEGRFRANAANEPVIFFCVENAPTACCRTENDPGGALTFRTHLRGLVRAERPGELCLQLGPRMVLVRHLMPTAVELSPLVGHDVEVRLQQRYLDHGRATIDAELRDRSGRLLLWAHDGRIPEDRASHGLALRVAVHPSDSRLAIAGASGGVITVGAPAHATVQLAEGSFQIMVVRLGPDDVSFAAVRR